MGAFSDPKHTHPGILHWSRPPPPGILAMEEGYINPQNEIVFLHLLNITYGA